MIRRRHRLVQAACLAVASALLWPLPFWKNASKFISQTSPFAAICDGIALRSISIGTLLGLTVAVVGIVKKRWFCQYVCPMGLILDGVSHIGMKKTTWWAGCVPVGQFAALLTIAGAAIGYPILLWMDPLAIFGSLFSIRVAGGILSGILAGLIFGILILLGLTSSGIWCARLCPLGGTLDLLAAIKQWLKRKQMSSIQEVPSDLAFGGRRSFLLIIIGAGIGLLAKKLGAARGENAPLRPPGAVSEQDFTGLCLRCGNCVRVCPTKIIQADTGQAGVLGLLAPTVCYKQEYCHEDCHVCTQVCPSGALRHLNLDKKRAYVIGEALMDGSLCVLALGERDCDACAKACPFNAIRIHWDEEQYIAYPIVDAKKCNGCGACEVACPTGEDKAMRVWRLIN